MAAVTTKTVTVLEHYTLKLNEAELKLIGEALRKLPFEACYATLQKLELQIQEQNFALQQAEIQSKVTDANAEANAIAEANLAAIQRGAEMGSIPTVTLTDLTPSGEKPARRSKRSKRSKRNAAAAHA